ncbi:MAG: hypothetical protein ACFFDT_28630, partial [Candidatus Hodarchaeota archaeon]
YYAYDRSKGSSAKFRTCIYNPTPIERAMGYIWHKIEGITYDNWEGKSPNFNHPDEIGGYQTYVAYDELSAMFTAQDGKKYAFNKGDYDVIEVYAKGGGWSDYHTPYPSQGEFEINTGSDHEVLVVAIVYNGISTSTPINHINGLENHWIGYTEPGWSDWDYGYLNDLFDIDLHVAAFSTSRSTSKITAWGQPGSLTSSDFYGFAVWEMEVILGLYDPWDDYGGDVDPDPYPRGTRSNNHGFDILIVYIDSTAIDVKAASTMNMILINYHNAWFDSRAMLHEVFHTYMNKGTYLEHLDYLPPNYKLHGVSGFIMGGPRDPSWFMHPDTDGRVSEHTDHYDGTS